MEPGLSSEKAFQHFPAAAQLAQLCIVRQHMLYVNPRFKLSACKDKSAEYIIIPIQPPDIHGISVTGMNGQGCCRTCHEKAPVKSVEVVSLKLAEFAASVRNEKIAVVGIGVSNIPLVEYLLKAGCDVTACDRADRGQLSPAALKLEERGARLRLGPDYLKGIDAGIIFRTPGLRPDLEELRDAVARGARLTSEMELFF